MMAAISSVRLGEIIRKANEIAEKELGDYPTSDAVLVAHQVGRLAVLVSDLSRFVLAGTSVEEA